MRGCKYFQTPPIWPKIRKFPKNLRKINFKLHRIIHLLMAPQVTCRREKSRPGKSPRSEKFPKNLRKISARKISQIWKISEKSPRNFREIPKISDRKNLEKSGNFRKITKTEKLKKVKKFFKKFKKSKSKNFIKFKKFKKSKSEKFIKFIKFKKYRIGKKLDKKSWIGKISDRKNLIDHHRPSSSVRVIKILSNESNGSKRS